MRMNLDVATLSEIAKKSSLSRVAKGTHPFSGPDLNLKRVADGTHPAKQRIQNGTHNFLGENHPMKIAASNGTHHWSKEFLQKNPKKLNEIRKQRSNNALIRVANGTHAGSKVFSKSHVCPACGKKGKGAIMYRFHYDNCKTLSETKY